MDKAHFHLKTTEKSSNLMVPQFEGVELPPINSTMV